MKTPGLIVASVIVTVLLVSCSSKKQEEKVSAGIESDPVVAITDDDTLPRFTITFILGKDENSRNPYYKLANQFYRIHETERTEVVIDTIFSLLDVSNYLRQHPPANGRPWGLINLVTHGNEFIDLSVLVSRYGKRVSDESLLEAIRDSVFVPLDSTLLDKKSLISLHGCAVGNNISLLNAIGIAFGGVQNATRVKASRLFEYYAHLSGDKNPRFINHYYAKVWYAYFKPDTIPEAEELAVQLLQKYPSDSVDWLLAVQNQFPSSPLEAYHLTLKIPVSWEDYYLSKEELPDLRTKSRQLKWLNTKTEYRELVTKTAIPEQYFDPKFYRIVYETDSGTVYSNKVKAKAGVICVIRPMVDPDPLRSQTYHPFIPAPDDTLYFGFSKPSQVESRPTSGPAFARLQH